MITTDQISQIEDSIKNRAEQIAYNETNRYSDRRIQVSMYELCKSYIILGARLFQEELLNKQENATQEITD